jgi:uncharacterized protein
MQKGAFNYDENNPFHKDLKTANMIVKESDNELNTLNAMYQDFENDGELCITMIVTRKCNFKCPYCYEVYENKVMDWDIYIKSIDFIMNFIEAHHSKKVYLSFFGGEPTLEAKNIIKFMELLHERVHKLDNKIVLQAGITTNGYLLDQSLFTKFVAQGIVRYQITIDGLEEVHNQSRMLLNGNGTWKTIINNVLAVKNTDENFFMLLRSNITPQAYANIDDWFHFLSENFGTDNRFSFHFETAKDFGSMKDENFNLCTDEEMTLREVIKHAKEHNLNLELVKFNTRPFSMVCYAARRAAWIIDYDGALKKCTSSVLDHEANTIGSLEHSIDFNGYKKAANWTSYPLPDHCIKCEILPICYGRKCPLAVESREQCSLLRSLYYSGIKYAYLNN